MYKIYGVGGDWYRYDIRKSVPDSRLKGVDALKFDSQVPFKDEDFTEYSATENRLDIPKVNEFFKAFAPSVSLSLYGVDIVVEKTTGKHLIIDCNYFSSYRGINETDLAEAFDALFEKRRPKAPAKEEKNDWSNYVMVGLAGVALGLAMYYRKK